MEQNVIFGLWELFIMKCYSVTFHGKEGMKETY